MRFRMGLGLGFAAGYVLGSRAGRERYEQIRGAGRRLWDSSGATRLRVGAADLGARVGRPRSVDLTDRVDPFIEAAHVEQHPPFPS